MPRGSAREMLAEFLGTFVLIVFGVGVVAQVVLSKQTAGHDAVDQHRLGPGGDDGVLRVGRRDRRAPESGGDAGAGGASQVSVEQGAAVLARADRRRVRRVGGRVSSTYHEALTAFDGGVRQVLGAQGTAGIWATYPQPFLSTFPGGFIDQVVGTALLVGVIFGITDSRNSPAPAGLAPVVVGLLVRADRRDVRVQRRLRDQPRARFRSAAVHVRRRLGRRGVPRRQQLVVGADRGAAASAACSAAGPTMRSSAIGSLRERKSELCNLHSAI